ncbi:hypothetical protein FDENT_3077 [Fusarium denticulatum]|uniref:Uncharacterized protein n=1 Tax=Fusarium denticulatum TaxID=48507 RepID=A0A8H5XEI4_9HYPO|nr:hypothetical protein FDENT_3077 [Fusarium denticulatum]
MGLDALNKLAAASEAVYQNISKKWDERKRRQAEEAWLAKQAEAIRQRNEFLSLITSKVTGDSALEMAPLQCNPRETQRAVFLVTTPISFGVLEVSQSSYKLVAVITEEFVETWSSCYYVGETTKTHDEIQAIVDSLVKELCNGKVISQAKLDEELSLASPKIARDLLVGRIRSKMDVGGESEDSPSIKEHLEAIKSHWSDRK